MRTVRAILVCGLLAAAAWPELPRYSAERRLRAATEALRFLLTGQVAVVDPGAAFGRVADVALSAATALPGDPRPWVLAGSAHLSAGGGARALELYREASARGERAEIDLNLGRAYTLLGTEASAKAAYIRGGWVSPALLDSLPPDTARQIRSAITHLEAELAAGRLAAPPPGP